MLLNTCATCPRLKSSKQYRCSRCIEEDQKWAELDACRNMKELKAWIKEHSGE